MRGCWAGAFRRGGRGAGVVGEVAAGFAFRGVYGEGDGAISEASRSRADEGGAADAGAVSGNGELDGG